MASSTNFFKLGFTPCKAEQSLRGMELQEEEAQKGRAYSYKITVNSRFKATKAMNILHAEVKSPVERGFFTNSVSDFCNFVTIFSLM